MSLFMDNSNYSDDLVFFVNGIKVVEKLVNPEMNLLTYLREVLHLRGSKLSCGEGGCGACTVMLSKYDQTTRTIRHYCVYACLLPLCSIHGMAVTTVEGVGDRNRLHPIQEQLVRYHGTQCGFCTPGMVMTMYTLLRNKPLPTMSDIEGALSGMICRCTGYRSILEGFYTFSKESNCGDSASGSGICSGVSRRCCKDVTNDDMVNACPCKNTSSLYCESTNGVSDVDYSLNDATQEFIFPPELMKVESIHTKAAIFRNERCTWIRPTTLHQLLELKQTYPEATLVAGNNDIGLNTLLNKSFPPLMIAVSHVPELNRIEVFEDKINIGGAVTMTDIIEKFTQLILTMPETKSRVLQALKYIMMSTGGPQTRNTSTIGGHVVAALVASDVIPPLIAADTEVILGQSIGHQRSLPIKSFCLHDRKVDLKQEECILSICIPYTKADEYYHAYRTDTPHRRDVTIDVVSAGMKVTFKDDTICDLNIIFGGVGKDVAMTIGDRLARLSGSVWNEHLLQCMLNIVDEHADMIKTFEKDFKQGVMKGFVFKFFHAVFLERYGTLSTGQIGLGPSVPARGTQKWQRHIDKSVGLSCHHTSSIQQTTGEALFIDDIIPRKDELFVSLVTSTRAHAKIKYIDYKEALELTGVKYYIDADDVPARNAIGANSAEEVLFARDKVTHCGQIIGAIIAESREIARHAAKRVVVGYEDLKPILTIEDAIEAESYFDMLKLVDGDISEGFTSCDHIIEGEVMLGGQEHYYLETHISQVIPDNGDQTMVVLSSTQNPSGVQSSVAGILGFPCNKIISKLTRLGGGFGGKETRSDMFACICAVAAHRAKQPMRLVLEREDDMKISGGRHPYLARYKVGCTKNGKLLALDVQLYSNGGHSLDMTPYVMQYVLLDIPNCYIIPNVRLQGFMCKTNLPSNTAMRGFGCPQAVFITEHIVTDIAIKCNISQQRFRKINFIGKDFVTNYGQIVENCNAKRCFDECVEKSRFHVRQDQIQTFNRENRFVKKGISVTPVIMAVGFHCKLLNQAGALVQVYRDGSVLLTHGGVEMGQGLYIKMIQIASTVLDIPMDYIHTADTSTQTVPNTSPTAASVGTHLNGCAVKRACEKIIERLRILKENDPEGDWNKWVMAAYMGGVSLSATGYYIDEDITLDFGTFKGIASSSFVCGAACSEVEIDCLTGEHRVLSTDIVMDCGRSINPSIDIGQIEGAFLQGYGLYMSEELMWSEKGELIHSGPGMYKLPRVCNIPRNFNIELLSDSESSKHVYSSRGVGEPPLILACSVFFATKEAIAAARRDIGLSEQFRLDSPAIPRRVLIACGDQHNQTYSTH